MFYQIALIHPYAVYARFGSTVPYFYGPQYYLEFHPQTSLVIKVKTYDDGVTPMLATATKDYTKWHNAFSAYIGDAPHLKEIFERDVFNLLNPETILYEFHYEQLAPLTSDRSDRAPSPYHQEAPTPVPSEAESSDEEMSENSESEEEIPLRRLSLGDTRRAKQSDIGGAGTNGSVSSFSSIKVNISSDDEQNTIDLDDGIVVTTAKGRAHGKVKLFMRILDFTE
jgi:hypothetical protein